MCIRDRLSLDFLLLEFHHLEFFDVKLLLGGDSDFVRFFLGFLLDEFNHLVDLLLDLLVVHSFFSAIKESHQKVSQREEKVVFSFERASANRILNGVNVRRFLAP